MLKRMRRHCVMMHIKNEDGLTLISTLFIMVLIALLLPFLISLITAVSYETTYDTLSIQQFFVFLRDELFMAENYKVKTNELTLYLPDGKKVYVMQVGDHICSSLCGGYEIFICV